MRSASKLLHLSVLVLALATTVALILGFLGQQHPALDSFAHFRVHLAVLLALAAPALIAIRHFISATAVLLLSLLAIATTSGSVPMLGMRYGALHTKDPKAATYTLLHLNALYNNPNPELVLSLIGRLNPDVITLNEVSPMWLAKIALIKATYRFQVACPTDDGRSGVAIVSRRPFAEGSVPFCDEVGALSVAQVNFGGRVIDVAALHLQWPWPYPQHQEIHGLAPFLAELGDSAILAGDLNATPWSVSTGRVADAGGLTLMPSPGATWLSKRLPASLIFAGLPIDQIFAKGDILVQSVKALAPAGSDHLPILVTFSIKPSAVQEREPSTDVVSLLP